MIIRIKVQGDGIIFQITFHDKQFERFQRKIIKKKIEYEGYVIQKCYISKLFSEIIEII